MHKDINTQHRVVIERLVSRNVFLSGIPSSYAVPTTSTTPSPTLATLQPDNLSTYLLQNRGT